MLISDMWITQKKLLQDGMHRAAIKPLQNRILPPEKPDGTQKTEKNSIYDFEAKISFNGKYSLDFIPSLKLSDECTLTVSLYDDEKLITSKSVNVIVPPVNPVLLKYPPTAPTNAVAKEEAT